MSHRKSEKTVLIVGSRTGGPLIPLLALKDELIKKDPALRFVIVGIRGGFEEKAAQNENLPIRYLPEVKRQSLSGGNNPLKKIFNRAMTPLLLFVTALRLIGSVGLALRLLHLEKPVLVVSMSNFLIVPLAWAGYLYNRWQKLMAWLPGVANQNRRPPIRFALHQMDIENLTARLCRPFVDLYTVGFKQLSNSKSGSPQALPNPIRYDRFDRLTPELARRQLSSEGLLTDDNRRPLLLIFGGGSGARFLNNWTAENLDELLKHFQLLHLTGFLQSEDYHPTRREGYFPTTGLTELMPAALVAADLIIARAGMASISEFLYLKKRAFLVPIPRSHQELNARAVSSYFLTLKQSESSRWLEELVQASSSPLDPSKFDYYTDENRHLLRDRLLELLVE